MTTAIPMPPRRWLVRIGVPLLVLLATGGLLASVGWRTLRPAQSVTAIPVVLRTIETDAAEPADAEAPREVVQAPGWVEAAPFSVYAGALVEGVVEELLVLEGDVVVRDQPVARLVDDDARIALMRADADVGLARGRLLEAQAELTAIAPQIDVAQAKRDELDDEHRRQASLVESGAAAAGPVARLAFRLAAAEADIKRLEAQRDVMAARVNAATAMIAVAEASHAAAQLSLDRMVVRSPIDGVVIERLTSPGSVIRFGNGEHSSHVVHMYDPTSLQVRADVPLAQAARVGLGHPAEIIVDVLPDVIFRGEVTRFVHRADLAKNTVEAKIRIIDPAALLKPDMLARVRILPPVISDAGETGTTTRQVQRLFAPAEAVLEGDAVMVVDGYTRGSGVARRRPVRTGTRVIDGWVEIIDGLKPGDRVITAPSGLADGVDVRVDNTEGI